MAEESADALPRCFDGAFRGLAQQRLEFREHLLDRVEIGRVGRQEQQVRARRPDRCPHRLAFVAAEIVEHDDITGPERRHQDLFDVGAETVAVDRVSTPE